MKFACGEDSSLRSQVQAQARKSIASLILFIITTYLLVSLSSIKQATFSYHCGKYMKVK